jgi:hypothetical protein
VNEQNKTTVELWDRESLKVTWCFDHNLMLQWFEILQTAQSIQLTTNSDALIWMWEARGVYTVKSMYGVVNFRGIRTIDIHCVRELKIPPKIQFFLSLLTHNKLLSRDNSIKRKSIDDLTCVFCDEFESCNIYFVIVLLFSIFGLR